jgi:uncharacterized protein YecT (DUF1311 family)
MEGGTMKRILVLFILFASSVIAVPSSADDPCPYCGVWMPYGKYHCLTFHSSDRLTVTQDSVSLPGCPSVKINRLFLAYDRDAPATGKERPQPLKAIIQTDETLICPERSPALSKRTLIEIELCPSGYLNCEELKLTIFGPTTLEHIKASYTYDPIPTLPGGKQRVKRPPRPKELGEWWFILETHDPCDDGTGWGAYVCSQLEDKKADEEIDMEWKKLLAAAAPKDKGGLISRQKTWLVTSNRKCAKEGQEWQPSHSWVLANEAMCMAEAKKKRSIEFRRLHDCIRSGKSKCPSLTSKP